MILIYSIIVVVYEEITFLEKGDTNGIGWTHNLNMIHASKIKCL